MSINSILGAILGSSFSLKSDNGPQRKYLTCEYSRDRKTDKTEVAITYKVMYFLI